MYNPMPIFIIYLEHWIDVPDTDLMTKEYKTQIQYGYFTNVEEVKKFVEILNNENNDSTISYNYEMVFKHKD